MLLIGDIHITSRYKDQIIANIKDFVASNPNEKTIIFLGDFVYHFSYDRNALLALYEFFLELFTEGKEVYVLAGNHDWLGETFVFHEAQQAFGLLNQEINARKIGSMGLGGLYFITEPCFKEIEGENVLFLPHYLKSLGGENTSTRLNELIASLKSSAHKNEQKSGEINEIVANALDKYENLTLIHHYYINGTKFPGQNSVFGYKDIALSNSFLDEPKLKMISGHLHQAFALKNYLCVGDLWSTSSLETNQPKFLFVYTPANNSIKAQEIAINPYFLLDDPKNQFSKENLFSALTEIKNTSKNWFSPDSIWKNIDISFQKLDLSQISLQIKVDSINYEQMEEYVDEDLVGTLKDIKLKKKFASSENLLEDLKNSTQNFSTGFADRKSILKTYLERKYPQDYSKYEDFLRTMKLL